jgi:HAD superfamily hydrolase (TIGR01458 family)
LRPDPEEARADRLPQRGDRLTGVRAVLLDLDGVLYVEDRPIPGAREAVATLRDAGLALRFVTNTTALPRRRILERLERLGFAVASAELATPAVLAVRHWLDAGHTRVALVMNDEVKEDFAELEEVAERAGAVIVGDLGSAFGYDVLNRAFRLVMDGAELVALQRNRYWLTPDGLSLDVGPFVAALEYATARAAHVVGKPAPAFFHTILQTVGASAAEAAMVGDDVESDVGGAQRAGLAGVLVRTGK